MKKIFLLLTAGTGWLAASAQYNTTNLTVKADQSMTAFTWKNMRVYPVIAKAEFIQAHIDVGKYTSLSEALKQKKLVISEATEGEQVNKLYAENISKDTIMILGGEVITGGKQDRMIASDFILPPKSGKKDLSVFCVEHGRWTYKGSRSDANVAMFSASPGMVNKEVRKAAGVSKNQSKVWDKVSEVTRGNGAVTSTGTYAALDSNKDYKAKVGEYTAFFKKILAEDNSIIGLVAVTGDSIMGCEMFATHNLLMQHADNVINSYATEAITSGSKVTIQNQKVLAYANTLLADETKQSKFIRENGTELKDKNRKLHIAVY